MDTTVTGIGSVVVAELRAAGYMESTIGQYEKTIKALTCFAKERGGAYTPSLGAAFASMTVSPRTGRVSAQRRSDHDRLVSVCDTYVSTGPSGSLVPQTRRWRHGIPSRVSSPRWPLRGTSTWTVVIWRGRPATPTAGYPAPTWGLPAFATVDMMREAVNAATPAINSQPRSGSPRTSSKPSTASDSASSLSRGISQATPPAQARTRFLGLTQGSA